VSDPEEFRRELIVIANPGVALRATTMGVASLEGADVSPLMDVLGSKGAAMEPLFGVGEDRLIHEVSMMAPSLREETRDLSVFYNVDVPDEEMDELAGLIREQPIVEAAYVKPPSELPLAPDDPSEVLNDMLPLAEDAPTATADFTGRQGYLDAAPGGIDARYAWTKAGGTGAGVRIIDLEWGWRFTHEDLVQNQGGVVAGANSNTLRAVNHGTAVVGEFSGDSNIYGITGICPDARVSAVSFTTLHTANAIRTAANRLRPGDIMLLEIHRPGPRRNFQQRLDQKGYIAIEWWPDDYAAIRYATSRGIIVVEAAGNGAENLDDPIYDTNPSAPQGPFPSWWTNPFKRSPLDSGAIVVGAGAPPPGTHGGNHGPDRSRLDFSNYGAPIDAQGWGKEVTTCGYGDLQGGQDANLWYTDRFAGTSSASPIVVGALGCVQGFLRASNQALLTPTTARERLRATGSLQQDAPGKPSTQRIGNRPNLRQLIEDRDQQNCFIATAAYGSELEPTVQFLREFRDDMVLRSKYRRAFGELLEVYYRFSPSIADRMEQNKALKQLMKHTVVRPTVTFLRALVRLMGTQERSDC
jgi:hypothetical protein